MKKVYTIRYVKSGDTNPKYEVITGFEIDLPDQTLVLHNTSKDPTYTYWETDQFPSNWFDSIEEAIKPQLHNCEEIFNKHVSALYDLVNKDQEFIQPLVKGDNCA